MQNTRQSLVAKACFLLWMLLALFMPSLTAAQPQDITLRGFVTDSENSQPLSGANVLLKSMEDDDKRRGAVTSSKGYYAITDLEPGPYTIRISFVGYQTQTDTLNLTKDNRLNTVTYTVGLKHQEQQMEGVVVTGNTGGATTLEAGRQKVTPQDLSRVSTPSVSGDLSNYLQTLPGVVSVGDRGGQLFIRGGSPDQNLVMMDKMQVYRPFHIAGFYSAFPQDLISNADVYAGGFPAKYSGRMSSVIDVTMRGGNHQNYEGSVSVGPFLGGVQVEGPLGGEGGSFLVSGRFSQIERTAPLVLGQEQPIRFGDQFFKIQNATDQSRCSVTGMHTYDRGRIDAERNEVFKWSNYGLGGRCVVLSSGSLSLLDITLNSTYSHNSVGISGDPAREASILNITTGLDLATPLKGGHEISGGFEARVDKPNYSLNEQFEGIRTGNEFLVGFTGYLSMDLNLAENLSVKPGVSVGGSFDYGFNIEPRIRGTWMPFGSEDQKLNFAAGLYRQTVVGITDERDLGSAFRAWLPTPLEEGRPRSIHTILGWRQQFGDFGFTLEGYHKWMKNLAVPIWSTYARFTTEMTPATGKTWGFDVRGELKRGSIYAYIGYGFSWTQYTTSQQYFSSSSQTYHPAHDQRHSISALFNSDLGFADLNIRWQFGSGMPYTRPFGFDSLIPLRNLQDPRRDYGEPRLLFDKPYTGRMPVYHRLDVSMKRKFQFDLANMTLKAGAINVYDRRNLFYFDLFRLRRVDQLPLIPFVAVEISTGS